MLIWKNFNSSAITYLILLALLQKFHFPIEVVLKSLQTQKDLELVFRSHFCRIFNKIFSLKYDKNWPNFINRLCLLH